MFRLLFILLLLIAQPMKAETTQLNFVDSLIDEAYDIRLSKPKRFSEIVKLLTSQPELTSTQVNKVKLLSAFQKTYAGNFQESETILDNLLTQNEIESSTKIQSQYLMLYNMTAVKNWSKGFTFTKDLMDAELIKNGHALAANALIATITFLNQFGQHELALTQLNKLKELNLSPYNLCGSKQQAILSKKKLARFTVASIEIDDAIKECTKAKAPLVVNILRTYKADLYLQNNTPEKVITLFLPLLEDIKNIQYPMLTSEIYNYISKAYLTLDKVQHAEKYALLSLEQQNRQIIEQAKDSFYLLYQTSKRQKKYDLALQYYEQFANAEKAYLDEVLAKAIAFQLAEYKASQQKNEIELLNNQNELLNNKNRLLSIKQSLAKAQAENTQLVLTLLVAIIALLTFFGYRSWRTQRRLKALAEFDYLTEVYNRGHFMTLASEAIKLATKAKQTVTCIIFDLDKFKKINDKYGHLAGDVALKAAANAAQSCVRGNDIFARLGGEEFVILLPGCDTNAATYVTEKCMRAFEDIDTSESGHDFKVTASFGITTSKISGMALDNLIADADKALYQAKDNGRNQYQIYEP